MSNQFYKFGECGGTFMGAHFEMDDPFHLTGNIKRNYIHSLLHHAHCDKRFYYYNGMKYEQFYADNHEFFNALCLKIKEKHKFTVSLAELQAAVKDFINRMEYLQTH